MFEVHSGGVVALLSTEPIDRNRVQLAFPGWMITDSGKRVWNERPDDMHEHYYVDIAPVQ